MKRLFILFCVVALFFGCSITARAESDYVALVEKSGFGEFLEKQPKEIKEYFRKYDVDYSAQSVNALSGATLFNIIGDFFTSGTKRVAAALAVNIAVMLLWAVFYTFSTDNVSGVNIAFTALLVLCTVVPVLETITAVSGAVKAGGVFMLSFVPIYFGIAAAAGEVSVAASSGALLLAAAEVTVQIIAFASVPVASAQLALAVSGSISEISPAVRLSSALKKAVGYIMTFAFTVFLALLSIQTAINSAADTVTLKTLKFMVGSFVPVAGSALSETVSVLGGSIKILQSGVGVYGIFAVLFTVGPTAAQLIVWRIGLYISRVAAEMLGVPQAAKTVAAVDDTLSLLLGVILFVGALFIIALAVTLR